MLGALVHDNQNIMPAGQCGPALLQAVRFLEKLDHFGREVVAGQRMHAKSTRKRSWI